MSTFHYDPPKEPFLDILFEDEHIIVVNKPSGILSVPGKAVEHFDSIASRVKSRYPQGGAVHRLDMGTSGVLVVAKTAQATSALGRQFQDRKTEKYYYAWVWGQMEKLKGTVDLPLCVDWENRPRQQVNYEHGRRAITHYICQRVEADRSLVKLKPITGRSHQLRVHMMELGHPILGDHLYAPPEAQAAAPHLYLHAAMLSFNHPLSGQRLTFEAPAPFPL